MIIGELKNKIDGLEDIFAAGGLENPLDVTKQVTCIKIDLAPYAEVCYNTVVSMTTP